MDHLLTFDIHAALSSAYDEPIFMGTDVYKSVQTLTEERKIRSFKNSFGQHVPGVASGATYQTEEEKKKEEEEEKAEKSLYLDADIYKGIDVWDVADVALWVIPGGWAARGTKAAWKLGKTVIGAKRLVSPIKRVYGTKKAAEFVRATKKGPKAAGRVLEGLAKTPQMKKLNTVSQEAVRFVGGARVGRFGGQAQKAADQFLLAPSYRAIRGVQASTAASQAVLGQAVGVVQGGARLNPMQQTILSLETSNLVSRGALALKQQAVSLPSPARRAMRGVAERGARRGRVRSGARRGARPKREVHALEEIFQRTPLKAHVAKVTLRKPLIVKPPSRPTTAPATRPQVPAKGSPAKTPSAKPIPKSPAAEELSLIQRAARGAAIGAAPLAAAGLAQTVGSGKKRIRGKKRRRIRGSSDVSDEGGRGRIPKKSKRAAPIGRPKGSGTKGGAPPETSAKPVSTHAPLYISGKPVKSSERYSFSGRPVTWKELQQKTKARAS